VGLASARTGLALSWQPTPGLDDNLASPAGLDLAWPSPSILVTHDGARSWSRSLTIPGGFWGLDTLNAADAWAIGVARLYRTIDAGRTWQRLHEAREPLVRVAFRTPTRGFGLTVSGRLVETNDSGRSWQAGRLQTRGVALCGLRNGASIVADQTGAIWHTSDGGLSWQQVALPLPHLRDFSQWWTDLSCQGASASEISRAFCMALVAECGTQVVTEVRNASSAAGTWDLVLTQRAADRNAGGVHDNPSSVLDVPLEGAAASAANGLCLIGYPFGPPAGVEISCGIGQAAARVRATLPSLPLRSKNAFVLEQGMDIAPSGDGWVVLDEYTAAARPSGAKAQTAVWATGDRGRTWRTVYQSRPYHP
jgi:hypothetical protein